MTRQEFIEAGEYNAIAIEILNFYVPIALELTRLQKDPDFLKSTVKAVAESGISDVVTAADIYVQNKLREVVRREYPEWQFWGEEGGDNTSEYDPNKEYLFITDPIEGTNNFKSHKDDQWGSVVALVNIETREPVIGIVAHPAKRIFYVGTKNGGAWNISISENNNWNISKMNSGPELDYYTYNNSPHFEANIISQVDGFLSRGTVVASEEAATELEKSRKKVLMPKEEEQVSFDDPESGALEAVRCKGTIYFKTSNEMAAVFVILGELGGKVTDFSGKKWSLGINTMIAARSAEEYKYLASLV